MKKFLARAILFIVVVFLAFWLGSILRCEYLTSRYGDEFVDEYLQTNMVVGLEELKVLDYSESQARVYYFHRQFGGDIMTFYKENDAWVLLRWYTVWSSSGSAEDFMWPYLR